MARTVGIGIQSFEKIIVNNYFYIDKTLNMNMLERFLSVKYKGQGEIFEGMSIWKEEKYRRLQGTYPVIFLSFADIKESTAFGTKKRICQIIEEKRG